MDTHDFRPRQIVCLEHEGTRLYAEVIQVVESRQVCWVRPLLLVEFTNSSRDPHVTRGRTLTDDDCNHQSIEPPLYDLRPCADLLWPLTWFRPALDTEVMPLLVQLLAQEPQLDPVCTAGQQLNQFIHQVWQAHQKGRWRRG